MVKFVALALVSFALTTFALGLVQYVRTRQRAALVFAALGLVLLLLLVFFASRLALLLFGVLPFALDLPQFVLNDLLPLAVAILTGGAAVAIVFLAPRRLALALALLVVGGVGLLGAMLWTSQGKASPANSPDEPHPTLADIQVPDGFRVQTFAADLQEPNALAFDDAGNLYYTELVDGNIMRLRDSNGDGAADEKKVFASGFKNPRGLAWHNGILYVASRGQINTLRDTNGDDVADENQVILDRLFSLDIQHSNNGIAFGPDGKLYIAIGGPRVGQLELKDHTYWYQGQPRNAWQFGGILVADADGKNSKMFARGLRNPYSLAFGADGKLFATDNGDETIPVPDGDELNWIEAGADYGYPYFFGLPPPWSDTRPPLVRFAPHSAPTGVLVYNADKFPNGWRGDAFVALYWHGLPNSHYRQVVRISIGDQDGKMVGRLREFISGVDRPTALSVGPDGALYIADMRGGKADPAAPGAIYRVTYKGK